MRDLLFMVVPAWFPGSCSYHLTSQILLLDLARNDRFYQTNRASYLEVCLKSGVLEE